MNSVFRAIILPVRRGSEVAAVLLLIGVTFAAHGVRAETEAAGMEVARVLQIHLEDDHSGSFFRLAESLDLDEAHALVLIDSHSDASAVARSDDLRRQLREVRTLDERSDYLENWRRTGRVQVFNWIEPLMPRPIDSVWWVAPDFEGKGREARRAKAEAEARDFLDARLPFEKRESGSLADRFHAIALSDLGKALPQDLPLIVSLDLDYFMESDIEDIPQRFEALWRQVLALPHLRFVTLSLSRPWLRDEAQANALFELALRAALELKNARLRFEPFAPRGPDTSELAKRLARNGEVPARLDLSQAGPGLRSLILHAGDRIELRYQPDRWHELLAEWRAESNDWRIVVDDHFPSADGIWRLSAEAAASPGGPALRVRQRAGGEPSGVPARVRWKWLRSERDAYDVLPETALGKAFVADAGALIRTRESLLGETEDGALGVREWRRALDPATGWGSIDLIAEIETQGQWLRTPVMTLRVADQSRASFQAGLSEQFQLPYVFGAGFLREGELSGADTGIGNDCANFLVYAWRRGGIRLPWSNPAQLRRQMLTMATDLRVDESGVDGLTLSPEEIDRGLVIDCGSHVAALWEDRPPLGRLDGGDQVVHHLGGRPERISLADLLEDRPNQRFAVLCLPDPGAAQVVALKVGGDICLSGRSEFKPDWAKDTDVARRVANLETALTDRSTPAREKTFLFRASPMAAKWLSDAGVTAVSLANNHSGDFGSQGLRDTVAALDEAGVAHFGTITAEERLLPWRVRTEAGWLAFFGVNLIEVSDPNQAECRVAELPRDQALLSEAMRAARQAGDTVLVVPHWGEEYVAHTTESQRKWARWLIDHGAAAIIGAHSHRGQPLDYYRGRPVFFSVGNLDFPGDDGPDGFRQGLWAELGLSSDGSVCDARLLPVGATTNRESSAPDRR